MSSLSVPDFLAHVIKCREQATVCRKHNLISHKMASKDRRKSPASILEVHDSWTISWVCRSDFFFFFLLRLNQTRIRLILPWYCLPSLNSASLISPVVWPLGADHLYQIFLMDKKKWNKSLRLKYLYKHS